MSILTLIVVVATILTVAALASGIWSMAHGGRYDLEHSERFMWARVGFQAMAVLAIVLLLLVVGG